MIISTFKHIKITSYTSSVDTIALNCLVFKKIAFIAFGGRQTDKQMDSSDALSRSRYRERRLNNSNLLMF